MKSAIGLIACLLAFAAGCSSSDAPAGDLPTSPDPDALDGDTAPLSQGLVAPPRPPGDVNPCAAVLCPAPSTCELVGGQPVCTPIDPQPPSGPFCGGFAGIACPGAGACVDVPGDGCNPDRGGADCGGVCECNVLALCVEGLAFDSSPEVCGCVPVEPEVDACASVRCRAGTHCEVRRDRARCVPDAPQPTNPCAAVTCLVGSVCEVQGDQGVCVPTELGPFCGGIAAFPCPGAGSCVDDPRDDCDPTSGGADCGGVCECGNVLALCIEGTVFDTSPDVCACVPVEPEVDACATVRCRAGTHCEARGDRARCVPDEPEPVNPCAAVLCIVGTQCVVNDGQAECVPNEPQECSAD
jgi:hypothetical protein